MTSGISARQFPKKQSVTGIIAFLMAMANYACLCFSLILTYYLGTTSRGSIEGTRLDVLLVGGGFFILIVFFGIFSLLGVLFGLISIFRKNKKKAFGILGLVLSTINVVALIAILLYIYL